MIDVTLPVDSFHVVTFVVEKPTHVRLKVDSDDPLEAYVLDETSLANYEAGQPFEYVLRANVDGPFTGEALTYTGKWAALFINRRKRPRWKKARFSFEILASA